MFYSRYVLDAFLQSFFKLQWWKNQVTSITISKSQPAIMVMFNLMNKKKVNYLISELSDCERRLLAKGLNFILPPKYLDYSIYLILSCSIEIFVI